MSRKRQKGSLFSQKIDRVAVVTYFLGAVVPLVALGVVAEHYVLPNMSDRNAILGLMGLIGSIGLLSLASFLILRHMTRSTLAQMNLDNARLATLLGVSGNLAAAQHVTDATNTCARSAIELTGSAVAYVFLRAQGEDAVSLAGNAGKNASKLYEKIHTKLDGLVEQVMAEGRPALLGGPDAAADGGAKFTAIAAPVPSESTSIGAIAVVRPGGASFQAKETDALTTLGALVGVSLHNADLRDAQRNFFSHVTDIIVHALDSHLGYNTGHGERVAQIANRIGRTMNLDDARMERLHFGALLHDIGMLKIDRTQQMSRKVCEKHPQLGHRMLQRIRLWQELAPLVLYHHEWYDGSGYPEGLAGDEIPLEARIIALAESFDTMTNEASYRETLSLEEAMREIEHGVGTQFDPQVVAVFQQLVEQGAIEV
jgi:putative nucleotidyltransferase with HDIG domain